jgi:hypothetical protein
MILSLELIELSSIKLTEWYFFRHPERYWFGRDQREVGKNRRSDGDTWSSCLVIDCGNYSAFCSCGYWYVSFPHVVIDKGYWQHVDVFFHISENPSESQRILAEATQIVEAVYHIKHSTIQIEKYDEMCGPQNNIDITEWHGIEA